MSMNLDINGSESEYFSGYVQGISEEIETKQHMGSVVKFTQSELKTRFGLAVDAMAVLHKDQWHHVYEWGDTWETRKDNAGNPARRLWKLVTTGRGANIGVGFAFLPSVVETPIHPKEEEVGVEQRHTFTWKAPVMEYGQTVTISPVEALHGRLVFYWEKIDKVVSTTKTITTKVDPQVVGTFTAFFLKWWRDDAQVIFQREIRTRLERDIVPRAQDGRFAPGRSMSESRALRAGARGGRLPGMGGGSKVGVSIDVSSAKKGRADAIRRMRKIAAGYDRGAGGEDSYRGDE